MPISGPLIHDALRTPHGKGEPSGARHRAVHVAAHRAEDLRAGYGDLLVLRGPQDGSPS